MAATLKLTNNPVCPFGQRVWLTLEASGLAYTFQETSITKGEKPAWFTSLYGKAFGSDPSSDGKVPVLEDLSSSFILTESLHCADYVAALAPPETRLLPQAPQERARCGLFMEAAAKYIPPFYALMMKQQAEEQATARTALLAAMATLATHFTNLGGPYLLGARPCLADYMLWPFVERLCVLEHYRGFSLDKEAAADAALAPFVAWRAAMLELPAVQKTAQPPAFFIQGYASYAAGGK